MYSFLLTFWTLSFDIFTYNVYHMCVNLILMHIWDAFGFVLKIGCDRQEQKGGARSAKTGLETGLTGPPRKFASRARPSFKELLAKYEKEGAVQKQKGRLNKVKKTSSKHREQLDSRPSQGKYAAEPYSFDTSIALWYCRYPCYAPLD